MTANNYVDIGQYTDLGYDPELFGYATDMGQQQDEEIPEGTLSWSEYNTQAKELYDQYKKDGDITALGDFLANNQYYQGGKSRSFIEYFGDANKKMNLEKVSMASLGFLDRDTKAQLAVGLAPSMIGLDPKRAMDLATGGTFSVDKNGQRRFEWSNSVAGELGPAGMLAVNALLMTTGVPLLAGATGMSNLAAGALMGGGLGYAQGARGLDLVAAAAMGGLGAEAQQLAKAANAAKAAGDTARYTQLAQQAGAAARTYQGANALNALRSGDYVSALGSGIAATGNAQLGNAFNAANALRTGNYLGAINSGLLASGNKSLVQQLGGALADDKGKFLGVLDAEPMARAAMAYATSGNPANALTTYIKSGGGISGFGSGVDITTPEFLKEFEKTYLRPAGDALASFDNQYLQQFYQPVGDALHSLDKNVLRPMYQPVAGAVEDVAGFVGDTVGGLNLGGLFSGLVNPTALAGIGGTGVQQPMPQQREYTLFENPYKRVMA